ncbi:MAG: nucleoside deaminase [Burkholderiales bacterium]
MANADDAQAAFHQRQIRRTIELAYQGFRSGKGRPFGALVARAGEVVAEAHNEVLSLCDPTAHSEVLAIRRAAQALGTRDLSDCDLYVIGLPCPMCYSAATWARIRKVYYASTPADLAALTGIDDARLYADLSRAAPERTQLPTEQVEATVAEANACYRQWGELKRQDKVL